MIAYICVGADDMDAAERFYSAFLPALGYSLEYYHGDLSYIPPTAEGERQVSPDLPAPPLQPAVAIPIRFRARRPWSRLTPVNPPR